jgi:hypothetical protein
MKTLTIYYSVQNCGDGSAYPSFFATEAEAESHQEGMTEGWGESCTGSLTMTSDSPITCLGVDQLCTKHNEITDSDGKCDECELEIDMGLGQIETMIEGLEE